METTTKTSIATPTLPSGQTRETTHVPTPATTVNLPPQGIKLENIISVIIKIVLSVKNNTKQI